jgi:lactate dehydrogenase-like 2-hydroxyacid dehydrogenase
VLTETTAELAASLTLAAARRIVEADEFMRAGLYDGWLPHLYEKLSFLVLLLFRSFVKYCASSSLLVFIR